MSRTRTYRCLNCLDHAVEREFDVASLSVTCPNCGSFERFVNEAVVDRFEAFESSPPAAIDWERLDRREKLLVAERTVRTDKTLDDFDVASDEPAGDESAGDEPPSDGPTRDPTAAEQSDAPVRSDAGGSNA